MCRSHDFSFENVLGVIEMLLFAGKTKWAYLLNCSKVPSSTSYHLEVEKYSRHIEDDIRTLQYGRP